MASKEEFKIFVKDHPKLIGHVKNGDMNWQKFYELYDLYGAKSDVWDEYLKAKEDLSGNNENVEKAAAGALAGFGLADVMNFMKGINLDELQSGVNSLQRVVGVLQDFGKGDSVPKKDQYKPRPVYKHFED